MYSLVTDKQHYLSNDYLVLQALKREKKLDQYQITSLSYFNLYLQKQYVYDTGNVLFSNIIVTFNYSSFSRDLLVNQAYFDFSFYISQYPSVRKQILSIGNNNQFVLFNAVNNCFCMSRYFYEKLLKWFIRNDKSFNYQYNDLYNKCLSI